MKISSWIKRLKKDLDKATAKDLSKNKKNKRRIERSLLSRLKVLGFILLAFSILFLFYAITDSTSETVLIATEAPREGFCKEFLAHETLNFFIVSAIFFIIGLSCVLTSWKRSKEPSKN
jgi:magnesium-transporting ATPase (P-type)